MEKKYDFAGWATRADMRCSDGRLIAKDAFAHQDGAKVPIVWNHNHATPDTVLGYGILHSQDGSMRVECYFNDTDSGINAKKLVLHGDINALSIYANQLKEQAKTQYSFTDDPTKLGAPRDYRISVRNLKVSAGAGFIVALTGDIMTMPGLPKVPAAENIDVDEDGKIKGLF